MFELMVPELKMTFEEVRSSYVFPIDVNGYLNGEVFYNGGPYYCSIEELYNSYKNLPLSFIRSDFAGSPPLPVIYDIFRAGDKRIGRNLQQMALLMHAGEPCCRVIKSRLNILKEKREREHV